MLSRPCRRYFRAGHQLLREPLRRFDACGLASWAKNREPASLEEIDDSRFEGTLRPHDREVHELLLGEIREVLQLVDPDRNTARERGDSRIPRGGNQLEIRIVATQLPRESVLTPAATDDQYLHANACSRSAIRSPTSSTPHERRSRSSRRPSAARRSAGTEACVIDAGWLIRLSTPPSDSASENT